MKFQAAVRFGVFVGLLATPMFAGVILPATGEGWCESGNSCNNTDTSVIDNLYSSSGYHNWMAFDIPNLGGITSATLSIWNDGSDYYADATIIYSLFNASSIDYAGLVSGSVLGTQNVAAADTGVSHYVDITLNANALSLLTAAQGSNFVFGGGVDAGAGGFAEAFGYTVGNPAAQLTLNASGAVPEPGTWAMLLGGLGGVFIARRRRA